MASRSRSETDEQRTRTPKKRERARGQTAQAEALPRSTEELRNASTAEGAEAAETLARLQEEQHRRVAARGATRQQEQEATIEAKRRAAEHKTLRQAMLSQSPHLQSNDKSAINTGTMEFNAQQIIDQALAEGTIPPDNPAHLEPDTRATLEITASEAAHLNGVLNDLRERGVPLTATEAEFAVTGLHAIAERNEQTARELGLHAIERHLISQNQLAKILGVSQVTVSRWYRERTEEPKEQ